MYKPLKLPNPEQQYLDLCKRVLSEGEWIENGRTGKRCLTIINADLEYDVGAKQFPILTTKQVFVQSAFAEMIGYLRGYTSAADFRKLGTKTWDANANKTKSWLENPHRRGEDDMGRVYGAIGRDFGGIDLLKKVYNNLKDGVDDRGEILTFWKPDDFDKGCLRPCMYQHHFSLVGDTLHLNSYQRSCDLALGVPFNMVQCYWLLQFMAQITGHRPGKAYHKLINVHLYEDQITIMNEQLMRTPIRGIQPTLKIIVVGKEEYPWDNNIISEVGDYKHLGKLQYPFTE